VARQPVEFLLGEGSPDLVTALEVVEAVVRDVVTDVPQAERRHRRQEGNAADDTVERFIREEAAVTGFVADQEQSQHAGGDQHTAQQLQPDALDRECEDRASCEQHDIQHEDGQGAQHARGREGTQQCLAARSA